MDVGARGSGRAAAAACTSRGPAADAAPRREGEGAATASVKRGPSRAAHPGVVVSTQIVVLLENRPGALAELASILSAEGVNIEALLLEGSVDFGNVRLHVDAVRKAEKALKAAGYQFKIGETINLALPNEPGQLADVCKKLAKAKVNIEMMFGTTAGTDNPELILMVDDPAKARKALGVEK